MRPMQSPEASPIFVIGTGRSGTTLLRMMLCAHPRIYLTHEASFYLWDALYPDKHDGEAFLDYYLQSFSYRWLRMDPAAFAADVPQPLDRADRKQLFTAIMKAKAAEHGKPRWGDKTPTHASHLDRIFADYPDARVVRIVRDPRGVVSSLNRMPWASRTVSGGTLICESERRDTEDYADRILQIRLEDLTADPRAVMGRVLDHVGEPWDDAVLDHASHGPGIEDMPPVPWFAGASKPIVARPPPTWRDHDPVRVRMIERLNRKSMAQFDYRRAELEREPSGAVILWRWLAELPRFVYDALLFVYLAWRSREGSDESDAGKALFKKLNPPAWEAYPGLVIPDPPPLDDGWRERFAAGRPA